MVQGLMQENAGLWSEREAMTAFQGGWSHGSQFPWPQGGWGDGQAQGKGPMGVVMEALRSSMGSSSAHKDKGMLGALGLPGERFGSGAPSYYEQGMFGGPPSVSRGNLMELFNMVSGLGQAFSLPSTGGSDWGKMLAGHLTMGRSSETSNRATGVSGDLESGQPVSQRGTIADPVRDEVQGSRNEPPGEPVGGPAGQSGGGSRSGASQAGAGVSGGDPPRGDSTGGGRPFGGDFPGGGGFPFGGGFPGGGGYPNGFGPGGFPGGFPGGAPGGGGPPG